MSLDTEIQQDARTRAGKARRRAIGMAAALGVLAALPLSVNAAGPNGALTKGEVLVPGKTTPVEVKQALNGDKAVVIAFLLPGITEDEIVQKRIDRVRREAGSRNATFIVYRITEKTKLGDLPAKLAITYTPAVAVIRGDDKVSNVWRGLVDEDIIGQNLADVQAAADAAKKRAAKAAAAASGPAKGDAAGIALAKKVNAAYAKVPAVQMAGSGTFTGQSGEIQMVVGLKGGKTVTMSGGLTVNGAQVKLFGDASGSYVQVPGKTCWVKGPVDADSIGKETIPLNQGGSVSKPVKKGANLQLVVTDAKGNKATLLVDAKTSLIKSATLAGKTEKGTLAYTSLDKAPKAVRPAKVC